MEKINYKIYTLGCKVNQYDSARLASEFRISGFKQAKNNADIVVINTCAVTKSAIVKSHSVIKKAKNENPNAFIVLWGCWPKAYKVEEKQVSVHLVCADRTPDRLVQKIIQMLNIKDRERKLKVGSIVSNDRTRYFLKIQDGCQQYCSYCIIPYARGGLKSRGESDIIKETRTAVAEGYKEIILTGIHLGLYGKDKKNKTNLFNLLCKIKNIEGLGRIRLSSIELNEVTVDLINLIVGSKKICRHLHIPLQSGSDKTLLAMNRPYQTDDFLNKIKMIRKAVPNIAITTDVIVGFPGESGKEFQETVSFIRKARFSRLHVFPYSEHEKTAAAKLPDKIAQPIIKKRAQILRSIGEELEYSFSRKFINKKVEIVVERESSDLIFGKTSEYIEVAALKNGKQCKTKDLVCLTMLDRIKKM